MEAREGNRREEADKEEADGELTGEGEKLRIN